MLLDENRRSFSGLCVALVAPAALALLLAASTQGKGPDRLGGRDDGNALPCRVQRVADPEEYPDYFGRRVNIDGDVAVAHSSGTHRVHVFRFDGAQWQLEAMLPVDDAQVTVNIAVSGDLIVAGAYADSTYGHDAGAAYVFRYDGSEWIQDAKLFASDPHDDAQFGCDVAIDGDVILIGAEDYQAGEDIGPGAAYVFERLDEQWIEQAKLMASDGQMDDGFGGRVTLEGDTIMVAAGGAGVVYYFRRLGNTWVEHQKIVPAGRMELSGDRMIFGFSGDDEYGENAGSASIYEREDDTWIFRQKLFASDSGDYHEFGTAVSICGDTALIGAHGWGDNGPASAAAYVFRLVDGTWQEVVKLEGDGSLWDGFGQSVAVDGDRAIVGAYQEQSYGAIYLYAGMIGADCNNNGIADGCDIFLGTSEDMNENGIPDECECPADFNGDGDVDTADLLFLLGAWGTPDGDVDFDGDTDTADLLALLAAWGECP